jgi:tetratricopeptide (TPR) repeat protein
MRWLFVVLVVACGGPQIAEHPKVDVTKHLPATLEATQPKKGEPRSVHVRVWADTAVRALPHWKDEINEQIDYAGQLLTPLLGVRITVDKLDDWEHTGSDVREAVKALAARDPGTDVTWVIGYIAPGDVASKALSELGGADVLGHYVAIRSWAEKPETDALAAALPDLKDAQRAEVIAAHKRHKQTVVLLHALAQTLGAIAEADPAWIQHPLYSPKQSTFSDRDRELLQLAIDARLAAGTDQSIAHDLLEVIEKHEWGGWIPNDHDDVVKQLRNVVDAGKAGRTAADVPPAAYEQFDRVRELAKRGELGTALTELENLMVAYPGNATMQEQKCELLLAPRPVATPAPPKGAPPKRAPPPPAPPAPPSKEARAACARVSEIAPGDPSPHLAVGEALARIGDLAGARADLVQAAGKIANLKTGQPEAWQRLVAVYGGMGALTWTEETLAAAKLDADPAAAQIAQVRARYGVPRGAKFVKPEAEAALVAALREANNSNNAGKYGDAERVLVAADKKWPGAAGIAAIRCDMSLRQNAYDAARAQCQRALAADPDDSWALYLSGVLALKDTSASGTKAGVDKLKRAIAVDPDLGQAWRALGKAYDRAHDAAAHDELAKQYQAKFGQALP